MQFSEYLFGMFVMMAIAGFAFHRMILLWEAARAGPAAILGAIWVAAVVGAMWFAWPRGAASLAEPAAQQRTALAAPRR